MSFSSSAWAVIVAAGEGRRFGGDEPKQFASLAGKPLLLWTIDAFRTHRRIAGSSVVLPGAALKHPPGWVERLKTEGVRVVAGGSTRTDSVRLGLATVPSDVEIVAVHDGVRPLITRQGIERVMEAVSEGRGAIAARPITDSLKEVDERGRVVRSAERRGIWGAETPQAFPRGLIEEIHRRAKADGVTASDCASLCERYGVDVVAVELEEPNLKVTRRADLSLAEAWIRSQAATKRHRAGG